MLVIVDYFVDAIAVLEMSRRMDGQWAAFFVTGETLSTAQVRLLCKFSMSDLVVVVVSGDELSQRCAVGYIFDLMM